MGAEDGRRSKNRRSVQRDQQVFIQPEIKERSPTAPGATAVNCLSIKLLRAREKKHVEARSETNTWTGKGGTRD